MTASERLAQTVTDLSTRALVQVAYDLRAEDVLSADQELVLEAVTLELRRRYPENPFAPTV